MSATGERRRRPTLMHGQCGNPLVAHDNATLKRCRLEGAVTRHVAAALGDERRGEARRRLVRQIVGDGEENQTPAWLGAALV